jgi:hypothetical protein
MLLSESPAVPQGSGLASTAHLARSRNQQSIVFLVATRLVSRMSTEKADPLCFERTPRRRHPVAAGRRVDRSRSGWLSSLPTTEYHRRVVGAGLGASSTHLIRIGSSAAVAGRISVGACIRYRRDQRAIPVDIDVG